MPNVPSLLSFDMGVRGDRNREFSARKIERSLFDSIRNFQTTFGRVDGVSAEWKLAGTAASGRYDHIDALRAIAELLVVWRHAEGILLVDRTTEFAKLVFSFIDPGRGWCCFILRDQRICHPVKFAWKAHGRNSKFSLLSAGSCDR